MTIGLDSGSQEERTTNCSTLFPHLDLDVVVLMSFSYNQPINKVQPLRGLTPLFLSREATQTFQ